MEFILYCLDKPERATVRAECRAAHLAYVGARQQVFRFGGPLQDTQGRVAGSLMILDLPDRAALDAHIGADPYFRADLFESVAIWQTRQVMPEQQAGALAGELAAARQLASRLAAAR